MMQEFRRFVLRGNVVDLAVGVVIGAAFSRIVTAIVEGFINPLVAFAGTGTLEDKILCVGDAIVRNGERVCEHPFSYGQVLSAMIQFFLIAAVVFFAVVKPVNALMERFKPQQPPQLETRECPECLSKIPSAARRCMFCTSHVAV